MNMELIIQLRTAYFQYGVHICLYPWRSYKLNWRYAAFKGPRAEQARQPVYMVPMKMCNKYCLKLAKLERSMHNLMLRCLSCVK
ncbi:hypothetical protein D3C78_1508580 [compost metagenome]